MVGKYLLMATSISVLSTILYYCITFKDKESYQYDNKNDYITIFCIILIVSFIILYMFSNDSNVLIHKNVSTANFTNNKPPF